ncbi:MAG: ABC transporter permease [Kiritimatiellae bacterium]|nr:ABC transporter permease [Kiritimatiellia bacterium]MDW8458153.1 ABC transporter permease [Verrucomicrobiota bacterium]
MALLPLQYAVRNLYRSVSRLVQLILGSALVVFLAMGAHALNEGMRRMLAASGSEKNVLILGAGSEESTQRSEIPARAAGIAEASIAGAYAPLGVRAFSPQIVHMTEVGVAGIRAKAFLRGVDERALLVHPEVVLLDGRFPGPGEAMVGRHAWRRLGVDADSLRPGNTLQVDDAALRITGVFAAPGSVFESEIWMNLHELLALARRETYSAIVVRLDDGDPVDVELFTRQRIDLELSAIPEKTYYAKLSWFYAPIRWMTWATALLIATAAFFGGLNTIHAAFAARVREVATLQAIGFSRAAVFVSFLQESMLTSAAGTLLGAAALLAVLSGRVVYIGAGAFEPDCGPETLGVGLAAGVLLGVLGTLPPAFRCLRPPLPQALRD